MSLIDKMFIGVLLYFLSIISFGNLSIGIENSPVEIFNSRDHIGLRLVATICLALIVSALLY